MYDLFELDRLRDYISNTSTISKSNYGVSADVWIIKNSVVVKVFNDYSKARLECELEILNSLRDLKVAKVTDRFSYKNREVVVYEYIDGSVYTNPNLYQIEAIGYFLKQMHSSKLLDKSICDRLYSVDRFKESTTKLPFKKEIDSIEFISIDEVIIHGDLFPDNALFVDNSLSAVIDFSDASIGDRYFDIAVVLFSWCKDDINKIDALLNAYGDIDRDRLKEALNFALLYYISQRYSKGRDWKSLYNLRDRLLKLSI